MRRAIEPRPSWGTLLRLAIRGLRFARPGGTRVRGARSECRALGLAALALAGACITGFGIASFASLATAQETRIETDGSLPGRIAESIPGDEEGVFLLGEEHGFRPGDGVSLIQSLRVFDLGPGSEVRFRAAERTTAQILARITGGEPSSIRGFIRSDVPGADLYLINPSGIVFGQGSRIFVPGAAFVATTADRLVLETGEILEVNPAAPLPLLRFSSVADFGFFDRPPSATGATSPLGEESSPSAEVSPGALRIEGASLGGSAETALRLVARDISLRAATLRGAGGITEILGDSLRLEDSELDLSPPVRSTRTPIGVIPPRPVRGDLRIRVSDSLEARNTRIEAGGIELDVGGSLRFESSLLGADRDLRVSVAEALDLTRSSLFGAGLSSIRADRARLFSGASLSGSRGLEVEIAGALDVIGTQTRLDPDTIQFAPSSLRAAGLLSIQAGEIRIQMGSIGVSERLESESESPGTPGRIRIRTGSLELDAAQIWADSFTFPTPQAVGSIRIDATDRIALSNRSRLSASTIGLDAIPTLGVPQSRGQIELSAREIEIADGTIVTAASGSDGRPSGDIRLLADRIGILRGAELDSSSSGNAGAGEIELIARDSIRIGGGISSRGDVSRIRSLGIGGAATGEVSLTAPRISIDGGIVAATSLPSTSVRETGAGGALTVRADRLTLTRGGRIDVSNLGSERGGAIDVSVRDRLSLSGPGSGISATTLTTGDAGSIAIRTGALDLAEGASISSASVDAQSMEGLQVLSSFADAFGDGENPASFEPGDATGSAGRIDVRANQVAIRGGASIQSSGGALGRPGDVAIRTDQLDLESGGSIRTDAAFAGSAVSGNPVNADPVSGAPVNADREGSIEVEASGRITLNDGEITASVVDGLGGDVRLSAGESILLLGSSRIVAEATGQTPGTVRAGGRIDLRTSALLQSTGSTVSADAGQGIDGSVRIEAPEDTVDRDVAPGPLEFLDATTLFSPRCTNRNPEAIGSLIVSSRAGLAPSPEGLLIAFESNSNLDALAASALGDVASAPEPEASEWADRARMAVRGGRLEQAEALWLRAQSRSSAASEERIDVLRGLAETRHARGAFDKAAEAMLEALRIAEASGDRTRIAATLSALGNALIASSDPTRARAPLERALAIAQSAGDLELASAVSTHLGNLARVLNDLETATERYQEAAQSAKRAGAVGKEALARSNLARTLLRRGITTDARAEVARAVEVAGLLGESAEASAFWIHLGISQRLLASSQQPSLAAAARDEVGLERADPEATGAAGDDPKGDDTVHIPPGPIDRQMLLGAHRSLSRAREMAITLGSRRLESYAFGNLGELYLLEQRFQDAEQLMQRAIDAARDAEAGEVEYRWHARLGRSLWQQGRASAALSSYRRAVELLETLRPEARDAYSPSERSVRESLEPIYEELVAALIDSSERVQDPGDAQLLLAEARDRFEALKAAELREYFRDECVAQLQAKAVPLDRVSRTAAVVYPIVLPDRLELLVGIEGEQQRIRVNVQEAELERTARTFQREVRDPVSRRYLSPARQLYRWLVAPYADLLRRRRIDTLVFVPPRSLRLPLAALHDGERFLIERMAVVISPGLAITDPHPLDPARARVLLAGVSGAIGELPELPYVPTELGAIRELYGGDMLLDDAFTPESLERVMTDERPSIVHLATHFQLRSDPAESYLVSSAGRISVSELARYVRSGRFREEPLELLVASACDTAIGEADAAGLGLIGLGVRAGARSAVGSLWAINDRATSQLMQAFYEALRTPGVSKGQALRRAQRELIETPALSHPYFWSAFLLINSWL